jgi:hypothetical protein
MRRLAMTAVRKAMVLRMAQDIGPSNTICPFDIAMQLCLFPRFVPAKTLEGMYTPYPAPRIVIGTDRPLARQRFTCAHELGHHGFGHGISLDSDEAKLDSDIEEEFLANRFAAALLMPKVAVDASFARRGIQQARATGSEYLLVAQDLGVGYTTLLRHLQHSHYALSKSAADSLCDLKLARLRQHLAGKEVSRDLFVVDDAWGARPVDLQIDDTLILPSNTAVVGQCLSPQHTNNIFRASRVGMGFVTLSSGRSIPLRVARRDFFGLARYRFLEDICDD